MGEGCPTCFPSDIQLVIQKVASGDFVRKSAKKVAVGLAIFVFPHVSDRQSLDECSGREKNSFYLTVL